MFGVRKWRTIAVAAAAVVCLAAAAPRAAARCDEVVLERFLKDRAFALAADEKIRLYGQEIVRYYDKRNLTRRQVLRAMKDWEERWPDRIYRFLRITDYEETDSGSACRVTFDYKFIAYSPARDATSAGIGRTSLVLAESNARGDLRIVGEWGDVRCRGVNRFVRSRC